MKVSECPVPSCLTTLSPLQAMPFFATSLRSGGKLCLFVRIVCLCNKCCQLIDYDIRILRETTVHINVKVFPHQISRKASDNRTAQPNLGGVTLPPRGTLKLADVTVVAVCTHPDLETTFHRLHREVLFHTGRIPLKPTMASSTACSR